DHSKYKERRDIVFLVLSGVFIGTLAMLNILGITRLLDFSFSIGSLNVPFKVFVGVLPYPITFLCTDFISEFYGKKRASQVVWVGFFLNLWVLFILWVGGILPPVPEMNPDTNLPNPDNSNYVFFQIRLFTFSATFASMIAYLTAQFVDVHVFHFIKAKTRGKLLWLRNNGSTFTSQLVDSLAVVLVTFYIAKAIKVPEEYDTFRFLFILIVSNYLFKMFAALVDTIPFYIGVKFFSKYLNIDPYEKYKKAKPLP
ncbi:MAG: queuosine precursor transporter, partial [Bacteroidales bacterium]|nr:queuosine precursor transporter [Bacteroidales bacterium]